MKIYVYMMVLIALAYYPLRMGANGALRRQFGPIPFASVAFVLLVGTITPWPVFFLIAAGVVPLIAPGNRVDVACRYIILVPLMPSASLSFGFGSHFIGQFNAWDMLDIGAICASLMASERPAQPRSHGGLTPEVWTLLVLLLIFGVAVPRFDNASTLLRTMLVTGLELGAPFWIICRNIRTRDELMLLIACFGTSVALITPIAVYEHHVGWSLFDTMSQHLAPFGFLSHSSSVRGGALRSAATMSTPIELGMLTMLGVFAVYYARPYFRSHRIWLGTLGMLSLAMLCAQSRGAVLSTAVGILVLLAWRRRWTQLGAATAIGLVGYALLRMKRGSFLVADTHYGQYRDYRSLLLQRGLEEGRKHPFFGLSLDDVQRSLVDLTQGEHIIDFVNTYLNVFLVSGLVGLGLLLLALAFVVQGLVRKPNARNPGLAGERARGFCLMSLVALLVSLITTSFYARVPFMLVVVLAVARVLRATDGRIMQRQELPVLHEVGAMPLAAA